MDALSPASDGSAASLHYTSLAWQSLRWRGILLLLATSMFLLVIATQRVRAVAALQMDFVASISHELRTPLAAMLSAGQNIADGFAPDLRRYGSIVTNQSRQLIDLVDQILLFAAMKDGKKEYVIEPVAS